MEGAATFTIVASRTSIVLAARTTAATSQRRSYDRALPARVEVVSMAFPSLIANDVCHEQCSSRTLYHRDGPFEASPLDPRPPGQGTPQRGGDRRRGPRDLKGAGTRGGDHAPRRGRTRHRPRLALRLRLRPRRPARSDRRPHRRHDRARDPRPEAVARAAALAADAHARRLRRSPRDRGGGNGGPAEDGTGVATPREPAGNPARRWPRPAGRRLGGRHPRGTGELRRDRGRAPAHGARG